MAMNVKFLKGLKASLPTSRDANTLYFVTDEGALYLGQVLIGANFTSAIEAANVAIKVINDHGYVNSTEVGTAIGTALESYYTKTEVDAKIGTLAIGDTTYNSVVEYVIAKTTGIATDSVVAQKADKIVPAKAGNIATLTADGNLADGGKTIAEAEAAAVASAQSYTDTAIKELDADVTSTAPEAGKGIQVQVVEADGIITTVAVTGNYDNKYDALGAADSALEAAKDHADKAIDNLIKTYLDGETDEVINTLEEVAAWINNDTAGVAKIIEDVATNVANIKTINESAVMTSGITAAKVGEYDTVKSTVDANKATWDSVTNKLDTSTYNTFVGSTYATLDAAVAAANAHADAKNTDIAKGVEAHGWGNHANAGYLTEHQNISGKADKVANATEGNFAGLDANGNLTNSGLNVGDFVRSAGYVAYSQDEKDKLASLNADDYAKLNEANTFTKGMTIDESLHVNTYISTPSVGTSEITNINSDGHINIRADGTNSDIYFTIRKEEPTESGEYVSTTTVTHVPAENGTLATREHVKENIQGNTNATVADVVNAVNALNAGQMEATNGINAISTSVADIIEMLTWGEF